MMKNQLKIALTTIGTSVMPLIVQADQPMSASQQGVTYTSGEMIKDGQLTGGYNQSADYKCDNGWDVFLTADYIYWDWVQDAGMTLGAKTPGLVTSISGVDMKPVTITPGYASGFQVGMGFNMKGMDDWNFYSEYTWYKNSGSQSLDTQASVTSPDISVNMDLSADVSMKYNNVDFLIQRPFYFGKKITANFYTGLKALWITNKSKVELTNASSFTFLSHSILDGSITDFSLHNKVSSWALGPKIGVDSSWLLGYGIKLLSNASISVLYTRYTQRLDVETEGEVSFLTVPISITSDLDVGISNYGTIRPVLETYLGLGWGSFFCDKNFHLDLSVGYDFNVHWNYVTNLNGVVPPVSMYLHGLNIQARFDF